MPLRSGCVGDELEENVTPSTYPIETPYRCSSTGSIQLFNIQEVIPTTTYDFESFYRKPKEKSTCVETVKEYAHKKWMKFSIKRTLSQNFPTISALKHYKLREYLPNDIVAGLTSGITMIPQGMAFGSLSTLPPIVGLYICLFASLTYFVVGTCHQLSWGCVAVLAILTGNILDSYESKVKAAFPVFNSNTSLLAATTVLPENDSDSLLLFLTGNSSSQTKHDPFLDALSTQKKIEVAGAVTLISGIILAFLGKLGLGRLTTFMSDTLITSFTVGVSFHVVSSQIKAALDLDIPRQSGIFKLIKLWVVMLQNIHHANPATIIISFICIMVLYLVKRFINDKYKSKLRIPVPIELIVVIIATLIMAYTGLSDKYSVSIVKEVATGVPFPRIPNLSLGTDYVAEGMVIIIVSFTQNVAMAKLMALKHKYRIDCSQEMFACGAVSVVCSMFSGFIAGPSVSRSILQDGAGGKTQVASLVAAALVFLVIMLIGPYFYYLPKCVLAAIIIINLRSMFLKVLTLPALWRQSTMDGIVWVTTCAATVILDTDLGLLAGMIVCVLMVLIHSQIGTVDVMCEISTGSVHVWRAENRYLGGKTVSGVKVIKVNSALYFANAEVMTDQVFKKTRINPTKMKMDKTLFLKANDDAVNEVVQLTDAHLSNNRRKGDSKEDKKSMMDEDSKASMMTSTQLDLHTPYEEGKNMTTKSLVLDLSAVPFVDIMGVQALEFLVEKYEAVGIRVYFANAQNKCLNTLRKIGFLNKHRELIFVTLEAAMEYISQYHNV